MHSKFLYETVSAIGPKQLRCCCCL